MTIRCIREKKLQTNEHGKHSFTDRRRTLYVCVYAIYICNIYVYMQNNVCCNRHNQPSYMYVHKCLQQHHTIVMNLPRTFFCELSRTYRPYSATSRIGHEKQHCDKCMIIWTKVRTRFFLSYNMYVYMQYAFGTDPSGLKRPATCEELGNTENLNHTYFDSYATFLRIRKLMTQFSSYWHV